MAYYQGAGHGHGSARAGSVRSWSLDAASSSGEGKVKAGLAGVLVVFAVLAMALALLLLGEPIKTETWFSAVTPAESSVTNRMRVVDQSPTRQPTSDWVSEVESSNEIWSEPTDEIASDQYEETTSEAPIQQSAASLDETNRIGVCLLTLKQNAQKASLFIRNYLQLFGSKLEFYVEEQMLFRELETYFASGQIDRNEFRPKPFRYQGKYECPPTWPILYLAPRHMINNFNKVNMRGIKMGTGDEHCNTITEDNGLETRTSFRQYFTSEVGKKFQRKKLTQWLPLGPRFEWVPALKNEIVPASERSLTFSFLGARTVASRTEMCHTFKFKRNQDAYPWIKKGQISCIARWAKYFVPNDKSLSDVKDQIEHLRDKSKADHVDVSKQYDSPSEYRTTLLHSVFALTPAGMSAETYRLYEAIDAGSIPVFALDATYENNGCKNSMQPLIDAGAPFVWLKNWQEAPEILGKHLEDKNALDKMQADLLEWKEAFWKNQTKRVDCEIIKYYVEYRKRTLRTILLFPTARLTWICFVRCELPFFF